MGGVRCIRDEGLDGGARHPGAGVARPPPRTRGAPPQAYRSEIGRALLERALGNAPLDDPEAEARRQSLLASGRSPEADALDFIAHAADRRGWK
jgi:hypothetical protein